MEVKYLWSVVYKRKSKVDYANWMILSISPNLHCYSKIITSDQVSDLSSKFVIFSENNFVWPRRPSVPVQWCIYHEFDSLLLLELHTSWKRRSELILLVPGCLWDLNPDSATWQTRACTVQLHRVFPGSVWYHALCPTRSSRLPHPAPSPRRPSVLSVSSSVTHCLSPADTVSKCQQSCVCLSLFHIVLWLADRSVPPHIPEATHCIVLSSVRAHQRLMHIRCLRNLLQMSEWVKT